ncbi:hypothetical protein GCM10010421_08990 [Streptomyces glaucus]|uniref:Mycothiol-dependent maleylpyruvate isomerase metal-binding domain-containing protein n=1 Tax=Streptomyces glaucus TaxID=284029 RepID=A0ABP5WCI5_9ACTN
MDVPGLLESASLLVPEETATGNDITVRDIWDHLAHDEWEIALGLLEELGDARALPPAFWEKLAEAAEQFQFGRSAAWCHWRCSEIRKGMIRAALTLRPAAEARRTMPIPGAGVLRPMWDIGHLSPTGGRAVSIASLRAPERARSGARRTSHGSPRAPHALPLDACPARPAARQGGRRNGSALVPFTVAEIRRLLDALLSHPRPHQDRPPHVLNRSRWRRRHQATARRCHCRGRTGPEHGISLEHQETWPAARPAGTPEPGTWEPRGQQPRAAQPGLRRCRR